MTTPDNPPAVSEAAAIAAKLTGAARADLTSNWDSACNCDWQDVTTDAADFYERQEAQGFAALVPVDEDALADPFAWDRGIEPGGLMWTLTPLGLAVRAHLLGEDS